MFSCFPVERMRTESSPLFTSLSPMTQTNGIHSFPAVVEINANFMLPQFFQNLFAILLVRIAYGNQAYLRGRKPKRKRRGFALLYGCSLALENREQNAVDSARNRSVQD